MSTLAPGATPDKYTGRANELHYQIEQSGGNPLAEIICEFPGGNFDNAPILKAIFYEGCRGNITKRETMELAQEWIEKTKDDKGFHLARLIELKAENVLIDDMPSRAIKLLCLSQEDEWMYDKELAQLGHTPTSKPAWNPPGFTPTAGPSITNTPIGVEPTPDPRGFVQKHVKKIGLSVATATALALGTYSLNQWNGSENGPTSPPASPPAAAASPTPGSKEQPPKTPAQTPVKPMRPALTLEPPTPAPAPTITTPPPVAATAPTPPPAPEVVPEMPKTANFPIVTRQNALGATFIDVEASRPKWETDGWKIESFISPDGNRGVKLVKNGKTATIKNLRIAAGIEVLGLNLD